MSYPPFKRICSRRPLRLLMAESRRCSRSRRSFAPSVYLTTVPTPDARISPTNALASSLTSGCVASGGDTIPRIPDGLTRQIALLMGPDTLRRVDREMGQAHEELAVPHFRDGYGGELEIGLIELSTRAALQAPLTLGGNGHDENSRFGWACAGANRAPSDSTPGASVHASVRRGTKCANAAELQFMRSHDLSPAGSSGGRRRGRASVWNPSTGASGAGNPERG
jgi:hypothetical protein